MTPEQYNAEQATAENLYHRADDWWENDGDDLFETMVAAARELVRVVDQRQQQEARP